MAILLEDIFYRKFRQNPSAKELSRFLNKHFPGGTYYSAYESGFCGFSVHRDLESQGIHNIIANAADVPTTDKDKKRKQKDDGRDSLKLAN